MVLGDAYIGKKKDIYSILQQAKDKKNPIDIFHLYKKETDPKEKAKNKAGSDSSLLFPVPFLLQFSLL